MLEVLGVAYRPALIMHLLVWVVKVVVVEAHKEIVMVVLVVQTV
jgi:hypothetical protein